MTRELPEYYPPAVYNAYITSTIDKWEAPTRELCYEVQEHILRRATKLIAQHFGELESLKHHITLVTSLLRIKC